MTRLTTLDTLPEGVAKPGYVPSANGAGIVHIGLGAFHKAHQAVYTDDALAVGGGDWRIIGVSLRSPEPAEDLAPQNGLFTVIERDVDGSRARVIGALSRALCARTDPDAVMQALCAPETRIVTITVTEKGYGLDRATGGIDRDHPAIAADLAAPDAPQGLAGLLVRALALRHRAGIAPFTVLSCDNLPDNGALTRSLVIDMARHTAPDLVEHISTEVAFPGSMVDRITPARTPGTLALAQEMTGHEDRAAIEAESFRQWVIEDDFPTGRPAWQAGGALFVPDVRPFELMKLRMLNGAHSMLAYTGFLAGHRYVRDVMADTALAPLVDRHLKAAATTLEALPVVDLDDYAQALARRFANPHLGHETYQIAMDGTEKLPQRILAPAAEAQRRGQSVEAFAFAAAAWMRYTLGQHDDGTVYDLRDPKAGTLRAAPEREDAGALYDRLAALPGLMPDILRADAAWRGAVIARLDAMIRQGMAAAIAAEAR